MQQTKYKPETIDSSSPHRVSSEPDVLPEILETGVNLCLWQRPVQAEVVREVSSLEPHDLPDVRCTVQLASFDEDVSALLQQYNLDPKEFRHWRADLHRLAEIYFGISGDREVTLRLVTTDEDDCRRFHVDHSHLRLLCTYHGLGTEWLTNEQVDRVAQASGAPNEDIIRAGQPSQFEPFWVGIMKGNAYPGNAGQALVHRSPPIARLGQSRVLICLDC